MKKVLVTYPIPIEGLEDLSKEFKVTYPDKTAYLGEEIMSMLPEYDGVLAAVAKIDARMIDACRKLKIISVYGAGYDKIDVKAATERGILVTNTPDAVTESTAEVALGLMLAVMRRISECDRRLRAEKDFNWGIMNNLGTNLYGKTLGIVGLGRIGKAVARRAAAFGMKVCYYNRNRLDEEVEKSVGVTYLPFDQLLKEADVVSLNVPLNPETFHLIGRKELSMMKPSAFLINTARGPVIDEEALVEHLKSGGIAGAGLDVFEREPVISKGLLDMDNVVLTPHIGTATIEARIRMAQDASKNIIDFFRGIKPKYAVNPEVLR